MNIFEMLFDYRWIVFLIIPIDMFVNAYSAYNKIKEQKKKEDYEKLLKL